jgi:hypothetical protein
MPLDLFTTRSSVEAVTATCQPTRRTFVASALAPLLVTMVGGMGLLAAVLRREK